MSKTKEKTQEIFDNAVTAAPKPKKRRRRFGDRKDGRKLRTLDPIFRVMPYIMARRSDAQNTYSDTFDVSKTEAFCREKVKEGYKNFTELIKKNENNNKLLLTFFCRIRMLMSGSGSYAPGFLNDRIVLQSPLT